MFRVVPALALALLVSSSAAGPAFAEDDPFAWKWYEFDKENNLRVNLYIFWRNSCPHCPPALEFANELRQKHPWLQLRRYELNQYPANLTLYQKMAQKLGKQAGQTPAFFFCNQMMLGYLSEEQTGSRLEANLVRCYEHLKKQIEEKQKQAAKQKAAFGVAAPPRVPALAAILALGQAAPALDEGFLDLEMPAPMEETEDQSISLPLMGEVKTSSLSLPVLTVAIAGCDAFNPCAFFVLLSLMGVLVHARNRWRMALVGGTFVLFSGLFYFLFMAAWLNLFLVTEHLPWITIIAGVLAAAAAAINIKDYFWFKQGVSLSIPEGARPGLFERMRRLSGATALAPMLAGTLVLAATANAYELLCTAGFPMIFTHVLTLRDLPTSSYYGYLALYNVIYVIPLACIVGAFTYTLGRRKLQEREGRLLKLLSGVMMLEFAVILLVRPALLNNAVAAVGLLAGAVAITAVVEFLSRRFGRSVAAVNAARHPEARRAAADNVAVH
jgi:hypothetical protein